MWSLPKAGVAKKKKKKERVAVYCKIILLNFKDKYTIFFEFFRVSIFFLKGGGVGAWGAGGILRYDFLISPNVDYIKIPLTVWVTSKELNISAVCLLNQMLVQLPVCVWN